MFQAHLVLQTFHLPHVDLEFLSCFQVVEQGHSSSESLCVHVVGFTQHVRPGLVGFADGARAGDVIRIIHATVEELSDVELGDGYQL